jgi:hypothetical protein
VEGAEKKGQDHSEEDGGEDQRSGACVGYLGSALGTAVAGAVLIGILIAVGTT